MIATVRVSLVLLALVCLQTGCYSKWEEQHVEQQQMLAMGVDLSKPVLKLDPSNCPIAQLGTITLPKCCTRDNQCGGDGRMMGYGCSSFDDPMFRAFLTNPPPPTLCSGSASSHEVAATSSPPAPGAAGAAAAGGGPAAASGPVMIDPRCPVTQITPSITAMGCCTPENHCGADGSAMGLGCTDLANSMFRSLFPTAPSPRTCDGAAL